MNEQCEVLVSISRTTNPAVLASNSVAVLDEIDCEKTIEADAYFTIKDSMKPGLYLWRGEVRWIMQDGRPDSHEPYTEWVGEFSPATAEDIERLLNAEAPPELFEERDSSE